MRKALAGAIEWLGMLFMDLSGLIRPHPFDDIEFLKQLSFCADFSDLPEGKHVIPWADLEARVIKGMEKATWH